MHTGITAKLLPCEVAGPQAMSDYDMLRTELKFPEVPDYMFSYPHADWKKSVVKYLFGASLSECIEHIPHTHIVQSVDLFLLLLGCIKGLLEIMWPAETPLTLSLRQI